jgi:hypothetical protein
VSSQPEGRPREMDYFIGYTCGGNLWGNRRHCLTLKFGGGSVRQFSKTIDVTGSPFVASGRNDLDHKFHTFIANEKTLWEGEYHRHLIF